MKAKTLKQLALSSLFVGGLVSAQAQDVSGSYWISGDLKLGTNNTPAGMEITNSSSVGRIDFKNNEGDDYDARITQMGNSGLSFRLSNNNGAQYTTALALHGNGIVQVPQSKLQIGYGTTSDYAKLDMLSSHGSSRLLSLDNDWWIQSTQNFRFGSYGGAQNFMIITNDGNTSNTSNGRVGIGTSSPNSRFHLNTAVNDGARFTSGSAEMLIYQDADNPNWMSFRPTQGNGILFNNNGDNVIMAINQSTKNVGIGTSNPASMLHLKQVNSTPNISDPILRIDYAWDKPNAIEINRSGTNLVQLGQGSSMANKVGYLKLASSNVGEIVMIADPNVASYIDGGKVGIGTRTPEVKLDVEGDIRSHVTSGFGITVTNENAGDAAKGHRVFAVESDGHVWATELHVDAPANFPDYVFADDYELMELSELEAYINEHKHLPNIPSAGEVEAAGNMQVAELLVKQMEKIEELTLYILEQEKRIQQLEADND